jgi:DegV family protein with EDD domain
MVFQDAQTAASSLKGGAEIQVIDSQTISVGLGFLVESAASAIAAGRPAPEVELLVRSLIPRIYGMLCIPGLSYLHYNGFVDLAQATVTEMLGLMPVFTIEEGQFSPMEKLKNHRQAASLFQEFMDEFDHLQHIAYVQSAPPNLQEAHFLRDHAREYFPDTPFTSHSINLSLSTLLGPRATGAFVIESVE